MATETWFQKQQDRSKSDFDVFLCHNSNDKPLVKDIGNKLKEKGISPWLDEWELRPGLPWQRILEEQIEKIRSVAIFVGKNNIGPWQNMEIEAFLREFVKRKCPVIPVILPGCQSPPELPVFLRGMTWVDFRKNEPDPMEQLVWGITGKRSTDNELEDSKSVRARHSYSEYKKRHKGEDSATELAKSYNKGYWYIIISATFLIIFLVVIIFHSPNSINNKHLNNKDNKKPIETEIKKAPIEIGTIGVSTDVYIYDEKNQKYEKVGNTLFKEEYPVGETIKLKLKKNGCQDIERVFTVNENKEYNKYIETPICNRKK